MRKDTFKKLFFAAVLIVAVSIAATGCMNRVEEGMVDASPAPSPNYMPQGTTSEAGAARQTTTRFNWTNDAAQIEARIGQISEISEARVVVTGNTALVGVKFNQAYRGEMTERIREMVAAEVMAADPEITTVAVTAAEDDVEDIYEISERTLAGREMDSLKEDIQEIVRNATTLR
ncbi:MAG: YhcN/YlaJ family sporulation lipoprotein [Clostridia bacterium]|nr:YhcN/YlaJ family sporulation lipoprotein [Clostridia bacterium]